MPDTTIRAGEGGRVNYRMNNIYLVGFMGTGKTSVGKALSLKSNMRFVDLDDLIEFKEKRSIADIFAKDGEPYFRRAEKKILKEVAKEKGFIVACGGGAVIDPENIKIMKETGVIICLGASSDAILKRTKGSTCRPLLNVDNPKEKIEFLLKMRSPFYAKSDFLIDTSGLTIDKVVEKISKIGVLSENRPAKKKNTRLKRS